jgi:hypothetical protein
MVHDTDVLLNEKRILKPHKTIVGKAKV